MSNQALINEIRQYLQASLDEWLGNDFPDDGSDDYETWQARQSAIKKIATLEDIAAYAAQFERDEEEFLARWGL